MKEIPHHTSARSFAQLTCWPLTGTVINIWKIHTGDTCSTPTGATKTNALNKYGSGGGGLGWGGCFGLRSDQTNSVLTTTAGIYRPTPRAVTVRHQEHRFEHHTRFNTPVAYRNPDGRHNSLLSWIQSGIVSELSVGRK